MESNQSINMKSTILVSLVFFGLAMTVHGFPGTRDTAMGQASLNKIRIKRSGKIFDQILAIKAAFLGEALELKKKGLAFLEDVVVPTLVPSKDLFQEEGLIEYLQAWDL